MLPTIENLGLLTTGCYRFLKPEEFIYHTTVEQTPMKHGVGKPNRKGWNAIPEASTFCRPKLYRFYSKIDPSSRHQQYTHHPHGGFTTIYPSFQVVIK
jgi:hypothetical protein